MISIEVINNAVYNRGREYMTNEGTHHENIVLAGGYSPERDVSLSYRKVGFTTIKISINPAEPERFVRPYLTRCRH